MARRKIVCSRADVKAQWQVLVDIGADPVSVKYHPDGTFRIMTRKHAEITGKAVNDNVPNEWDDVLK